MRWRAVGCWVVAAALASGLAGGVATAAADDGGSGQAAPKTLTQGEAVTSGGVRTGLDLADPGSKATVPGSEPIAVSLGDSYISGEDGRWAGNVDFPWRYEYADALGPSAYLDLAKAEAIPACHRSKAAAIHFGKGVTSINLACSGAVTKTDVKGDPYKPGIDFVDTALPGGARAEGQAKMLKNLAMSNEKGRIKLVTLSIGGNDFQFAHIVETCLKQYLLAGTPCSKLGEMTDLFGKQNLQRQREAIAGAMANVIKAMTDAGYSKDEWTLLVQTYPSPVAGSKTIRYKENYARQFEGGCGLYDRDLDWANDFALYQINETVKYAVLDNRAQGNTNIKVLDLAKALLGHRLCEQNTSIVGKIGVLGKWSPIRNWKQANAVDNSEWVGQIRVTEKANPLPPFTLEESLHPNYWAQKGYQNCMRQAYNGGKIRGGICIYGGLGLNADGLPWLELDPSVPFSAIRDRPTLGRKGRKAPAKVTRLRKQKAKKSYVIKWGDPRDKSPVTQYFYRYRSSKQEWSGWINAGRANAIRLIALRKGVARVKVVAQNGHGTGKVVALRFRIGKRG